MSFQTDIGIAFNETIAVVQTHDRDWFLSPKFQQESKRLVAEHQKSDTERHVNRRGPRSLMEMALELVIDNLHTITEETMANVPLPYLWRIYDECGPRRISFHTWKMLSKALLADKDRDINTFPPQLYSYSVEICSPSAELSYYTQPLACSNIDFLSYLTIENVDTFQTDELLALAKLKNLVVLEIIESVTAPQSIRVTDHLVKGWSETEDAFPLLQNLRITGLLTSYRSLQYLSKFPSLTVYEVCNGSWTLWDSILDDEGRLAKDHGWSIVDAEWASPSESLLPALEVSPEMRSAHLRLRGSHRNPRVNPKNGVEFRRIKSSPSGGRPKLKDRQPKPKDIKETQLKPRKRQKMQDLLASFGG